MIVRILHEAQYRIDDATTSKLEALEKDLEAALANNDQEALDQTLGAIESLIHGDGEKLDDTELTPSDLTVPALGSTIEELKELLSQGESN